MSQSVNSRSTSAPTTSASRSCLVLMLTAAMSTAHAESVLQVLPPADALQGAGCIYTSAANGQLMMVVDARSAPRERAAVARVQVDGVVQQLDLISAGDTSPYRYANEQIVIEAILWVDDPQAPACEGECEGSFHLAQLRASSGKRTEQLQVKVHCGA